MYKKMRWIGEAKSGFEIVSTMPLNRELEEGFVEIYIKVLQVS